MNWIDSNTFIKLDVVPEQFFYFMEELNPQWINKTLNFSHHNKLYEYFFSGGEVMHRCTDKGYLELLILINDLEPILLAKAKLGIKVVECQNNRFVFHLLIWDQEDSPLEIPFIFQLADPVHRYRVCVLLEQVSVPVYFIKKSNDNLIVSFSRELHFPDKLRNSLRDIVINAYNPEFNENEHNTYSRAEEDFILASSIELDEIASSGWTYQFDLDFIKQEYSEAGVNEYINQVINHITILLDESNYKGVKEGPFYIWFTQKNNIYGGVKGQIANALILFVTPFYNERAPRASLDIEPIYDFIKGYPGFVRVESGNPIFENALPLFQYSNGELIKIQVDKEFLEIAVEIQENFLRLYGGGIEDNFSIYKMLIKNE